MKNITLYGNCTKDAETRTTQSGQDVTGFDIAVNDRRTKEVYYFTCSYWGKGGSAVQPYLKKGTSVVISGEFSWREYNDRKYLQCNVDSLSFAGNSKSNLSKDTYDKKEIIKEIDDEIPF